MFSEINRSNHYYFRDFTLTISFSFNPFRVQYSSFLPTSVLNKSFLNKLNETKQWELRHFDRIKFQFHFNCWLLIDHAIDDKQFLCKYLTAINA